MKVPVKTAVSGQCQDAWSSTPTQVIKIKINTSVINIEHVNIKHEDDDALENLMDFLKAATLQNVENHLALLG